MKALWLEEQQDSDIIVLHQRDPEAVETGVKREHQL